MRLLQRTTLAAVTLSASFALALATPAIAQDYPMTPGDYVDMDMITVDDGHALEYANVLAGKWKEQQEFALKQGWITGYEVLANVDKRPGEPDLYLVTRFKTLPDPAEMDRREAMFKANMKMTDAQLEAASGDRAKFRHVVGSQMLQVLKFK